MKFLTSIQTSLSHTQSESVVGEESYAPFMCLLFWTFLVLVMLHSFQDSLQFRLQSIKNVDDNSL